MDIDEDDDFYAPEESEAQTTTAEPSAAAPAHAPAATETKTEQQTDELEEGEEEDEGGEMDEDDSDDSDVEIVTERKDGTKAPPPSQSRYSDIRNIPQRSTANDATVKAAPIKKEERKPSVSGADLPAVSTSKVDINAIPIHKATGKPITQVNIDEDLADNDKPWRKPGTDLSDYFNYGFDEFTWALYAQKQETLRGEYNQDALAQKNRKMLEEMGSLMMLPGMMPGMGGAAPGPGGAPAVAAAAVGMPGMDGVPPEMQAMMQQMMAGGMDPSQMDPSAMSAMFAGMQGAGGAGGQGPQGGQGQNFGGGGFDGNQGQGYGYNQQQGMGGGGGRGNFGHGRGRGGRRNW
ncbi:Fip1 domain-containing protein [Coniochaeta sp. 2T2.1]|nr:Fip1 domain-containing protein [Coniochaeta sp. 2T2.1]